MKGRISDDARLRHIAESATQLTTYTQGLDYETFAKDQVLVLASIRLLEVIGEAASRLSEELREDASEVPWRKIIGLRNVLIHQYFEVSTALVWEIIQYDLPDLRSKIQKLIAE